MIQTCEQSPLRFVNMVSLRKIMLYNEVRVFLTISGEADAESQVNDLSEQRMATCKCMMPDSKAD